MKSINFLHVVQLASSVILAALVAGCKPQRDPFLDLADAKSNVLQIDDLARAMELVFSDQSYNQKEFEDRVGVSLNRWLKKIDSLPESDPASKTKESWKLDPAVTPLVNANANLDVVARTTKRSFVGSDAFFLRQRAWENRLAERICSATPIQAMELYRVAAKVDVSSDPEPGAKFDVIVNRLHSELNADDARKLAEAMTLFDWVVRNIQLEQPIEVAPENVEDERLNPDGGDNLPKAGVRGLGYLRFVWQLLYFARGDYVERARLFIALCRQRGLDAAMLEVAGKPWAVGVLINGQLYLFDTRLGLPIPGGEPGRIATLADVRAQPELLDRLDLTVEESTKENTKYWVKAGDIGAVVALIWTTPESISRRMKSLQDRLVGEYQVPLADSPTSLLQRFEGIEGVKPAVWDIEYKTHQFRHALRTAIAQSTFDDNVMGKIIWYYQEEAYIDGFAPYRTARDLFVLGRFESERTSNKLNAIESFYNLIYSDRTIDQLSLNRVLLGRLGIRQEKGQSAADFQNRLRSVQEQMRMVRRDAGLFLAQSQFDNGNISAGANWLVRVRDRSDTSRWIPSINYLLGRAHESQREYERAIEQYKKSDSAQFHGELIRARMLAALTQAPAETGVPAQN